jgi:hypothetical protein
VAVVGLKARVGDPNMAGKAPASEIVKVGKPPVYTSNGVVVR